MPTLICPILSLTDETAYAACPHDPGQRERVRCMWWTHDGCALAVLASAAADLAEAAKKAPEREA